MTSSRKTVAYASYVSPFPPNSGERIRALNLISALSALGYAVEAIVGNYDGVALATHDRDRIHFRQIPFAWPRLRQAASVYFRAHAGLIEQIRALHATAPLDAVIMDYGFMGAQIAPLAEMGLPVVLGTHNLESTLTGQVPRQSLGGKLAIRFRQFIETAHERQFFRLADAVICVSDDDREAYRRFLPDERLHVVPNFIDVPDVYADAPRQDRIIMTGSFGNFQNLAGLRWFIDEVWDAELSRLATLCIAGKLSDQVVRDFAHVPGVIGLGPRDDLLGEIARSRAAIVPLWHGGGTRLKCLEAMAVRTPIVTTSKGCEGIDHGGCFLVADTAAVFKSALLTLLRDPVAAARQAAAGRALFDRRYSLPANATRLEQAIDAARHVSARRRARMAIA